MAKLLVTPTDKLTGLPLPILNKEPRRFGALSLRKDYHHHFHPKSSNELAIDVIGGKALRYSRGQLISRSIHQNYHEIYRGPQLPQNAKAKFITCVLAVAGVVPRQAIDVSNSSDNDIVNLSNKAHRQMSSPNRMYIHYDKDKDSRYYSARTIGEYFANYALMQGSYDVIDTLLIEQFLDKKAPPNKKREIGNLMISAALKESVQDVKDKIPDLAREGYLASPLDLNPLRVVTSFFSRNHFAEYHAILESKLNPVTTKPVDQQG